ISGTSNVVSKVKKSLQICDGAVDLELRTTVFRGMVGSDEVEKIAEDIATVDCEYVIQLGLPDNAWDERLRGVKEYDRDELINIGKSAIKHLKKVKIRSKEPEISISSDMFPDS
ncbi:MAG: hypothetical protein SVK08_10575, partial [Halobacteriota archaeon]|nr:hypothetical protein [Halobacteriota archaeon]